MDSIFVGCTILAAGFVYFINPYNLVPGGVYGASIVLHNLFPSIQVGTSVICLIFLCLSFPCWYWEQNWEHVLSCGTIHSACHECAVSPLLSF